MPVIRSLAKVAVGRKIMKESRGNGLLRFGAGLVAARVATRSIPGALLVGGAIVGKKLYDRRKARTNIEAKDMVIDQ